MTALLEQVGEMIGKMNRSEKAQILQWVVSDLGDAFPGIDSRSDVCGGELCVVRTRIPVWTLVQARRLGVTESDLLKAYPSLNAGDLAEAWAYYRTHSELIESQIRDSIGAHAFAEDVERHLEENTRRHPTGGSRRLGG